MAHSSVSGEEAVRAEDTMVAGGVQGFPRWTWQARGDSEERLEAPGYIDNGTGFFTNSIKFVFESVKITYHRSKHTSYVPIYVSNP